MAARQEKEALQTVVISCFSAILSGDQQQRKDAEEELKALEVTEDFGVVLAEITLETEGPVPYRQLASVILKQYVKNHWSDTGEYCDPIPGEEAKAAIRNILLRGLGDSLSKIRSAVAYAVSAIAQHDWPDNWPNLFDQLMVGLGTGSPDLVHGTMRVLAEFCHEVSDTQIPQVAPVILPQLLRVIGTPQLYSVRTRSRAVNIFRILSRLIHTMSDLFPEAAYNLLFPLLPSYIEHFVQMLTSHDDVNNDPGLRKEIITVLASLIEWFPALLRPHFMTIVTPVWKILVSSTGLYVQNIINSSDSLVDVYDSDGETINFDSVLFAIFKFIASLLDYGCQPQLFPPILPELIYHLLTLTQITSEQVILWENDVCRFMEDDESELAFSVRLAAYDLLMQFSEEKSLQDAVYKAVHTAVDRHLTHSTQESHTDWWRIHEACLLIVGAIIIDSRKQQLVQFNSQLFANNVLLPDLTSSVSSPFLTGRCLWLAGKMSAQLDTETLQKCLQATVSGLQSTQHGVVRIMAAKASNYFCYELNHSDHRPLLVPYISYFISELCNMASDSPEDLLFVIIDSLQQVCQIDEVTTAAHVERLVPLSLALFLKFSHDPSISACLEDLFVCLSANRGCHPLLHSRLLPTAVELLSATESQIPLGMVSSTLDILVIIIRGCTPPLPPLFMNELFKVVVHKILTSEDPAILQSGGECVRAYLSVAANQLMEWVDEPGRSGLQYVAEVMMHLLDPARPEYSAAFVYKLIIVFVKKVGSALGNYLELLLRSVLSKMQQAQTSSVMQSLLVVFAHLASNQQLEGLLSFLSQVPDPSGRPALEYVITEWCVRHSFFFGTYEQRVSTMALCLLLSHCVNTGDQRLNNIIVVEEEVSAISDGIVTRSKKASSGQRWTQTPLPVKLLKVLIEELRTQIENIAEDNVEDDEVDEPWSSDSDDMVNTLEMLLGNQVNFEDDETDDPDLKDEALLKVDLHSHLIQYLTELSRQPCFPSLLLHLSPYEKETLGAVGAIVCS